MALFLLLLLVGVSEATHFLGTVMTYDSKTNVSGIFTVVLRYKTNFQTCNASIPWECRSGDCGSSSVVLNTVFNESSGAWCQREGIMTRQVTANAPFQLWLNSSSWISNINDIVSVRALTLVELRTRSDTGKANRSPQTTVLPVLRVPSNCPRTTRLLAFDPDGDTVECRYGNPSQFECNPCTPPSVLNLISTCDLVFGATNSSAEGLYAVQLVMQDFPVQPITLTDSSGLQTPVTTSTRVSEIPVQFAFRVDPAVPSCTDGFYLPGFQSPTPANRAQLQASVNQVLEISIKAVAVNSTISELLVSGPHNMNQTTSGAGDFTLSWMPSESQSGENHPICFAVQSVSGSDKYHSELRCVIVTVANATSSTTSATTTAASTSAVSQFSSIVTVATTAGPTSAPRTTATTATTYATTNTATGINSTFLVNPSSAAIIPVSTSTTASTIPVNTSTTASTIPVNTSTTASTIPVNTSTTPSPIPVNTTATPSPIPVNTTVTPSIIPVNTTATPSPIPVDTTVTPSPIPVNTTVTPSIIPVNTTATPSPIPVNTTVTPSIIPVNTTATPSPIPVDTTVTPSPIPVNTTVTPSIIPVNTTATPSPIPVDTTVTPSPIPVNTTVTPSIIPVNTTATPSIIPVNTTATPSPIPVNTTVTPSIIPINTTATPSPIPVDTTVTPSIIPVNTTATPSPIPVDTTVTPSVIPVDTTTTEAITLSAGQVVLRLKARITSVIELSEDGIRNTVLPELQNLLISYGVPSSVNLTLVTVLT